MEFYWNPWGVAGVLAMLFSFAAAAFVFFAQPGGSANRRLALVLTVEGAAIGGGAGLIYFMFDEVDAYAAQAVSVTATLFLPSLYLHFLAVLETPLVRPLRFWPVQVVVWGIAAVSLAFWFLRPGLFVTEMSGPYAYDYTRWEAEWGTTYRDFRFFALAVYLFGLVASVHSLLIANGTLTRARARAFVYAFGLRDGFQVAFIGVFFFLPRAVPTVTGAAWFESFFNVASVVAFPIMIFLYIPILAYGILRTNLFDIDVKIKWTINRGVIAFVFLAVFFVVAQLVQNLTTQALGWSVGGIAAGLLLFALAPIQRFAERLADTAMPRVKPLAEMSQPERVRLYREQVHFAWADGTLTKKERVLLDHLRDRLGVGPEEAARMEYEVTSG